MWVKAQFFLIKKNKISVNLIENINGKEKYLLWNDERDIIMF